MSKLRNCVRVIGNFDGAIVCIYIVRAIGGFNLIGFLLGIAVLVAAPLDLVRAARLPPNEAQHAARFWICFNFCLIVWLGFAAVFAPQPVVIISILVIRILFMVFVVYALAQPLYSEETSSPDSSSISEIRVNSRRSDRTASSQPNGNCDSMRHPPVIAQLHREGGMTRSLSTSSLPPPYSLADPREQVYVVRKAETPPPSYNEACGRC